MAMQRIVARSLSIRETISMTNRICLSIFAKASVDLCMKVCPTTQHNIYHLVFMQFYNTIQSQDCAGSVGRQLHIPVQGGHQ